MSRWKHYEDRLSELGCDEETIRVYVKSQLQSALSELRDHLRQPGLTRATHKLIRDHISEIQADAQALGFTKSDLKRPHVLAVNDLEDGSAEIHRFVGIAETSRHQLGALGEIKLSFSGPLRQVDRKIRQVPKPASKQEPADLLAQLEQSLKAT